MLVAAVERALQEGSVGLVRRAMRAPFFKPVSFRRSISSIEVLTRQKYSLWRKNESGGVWRSREYIVRETRYNLLEGRIKLARGLITEPTHTNEHTRSSPGQAADTTNES
jgi:hypothetical protein